MVGWVLGGWRVLGVLGWVYGGRFEGLRGVGLVVGAWWVEPYRVCRRVLYLSPASWTRFC